MKYQEMNICNQILGQDNALPSKKWQKKILRPILTYADEAHHVPADTYQKIMKHD